MAIGAQRITLIRGRARRPSRVCCEPWHAACGAPVPGHPDRSAVDGRARRAGESVDGDRGRGAGAAATRRTPSRKTGGLGSEEVLRVDSEAAQNSASRSRCHVLALAVALDRVLRPLPRAGHGLPDEEPLRSFTAGGVLADAVALQPVDEVAVLHAAARETEASRTRIGGKASAGSSSAIRLSPMKSA